MAVIWSSTASQVPSNIARPNPLTHFLVCVPCVCVCVCNTRAQCERLSSLPYSVALAKVTVDVH